jgi:hypothetical protein
MRLTEREATAPLRPEACVCSPDGRYAAYVREVAWLGGVFNQIFVAEMPAASR